jgi:two-component system, chemotaxis family, response regulator Rcp1
MGPKRGCQHVEVLLVEDNPGDVRLTLEAFKNSKVKTRLSIVGDGVEAMAFLRREGKYVNAPRPDLVLLDLNLPRKDGRAVLVEIKGEENLKCIPVVILTTSQAKSDILTTYRYHANCYIPKPVEFELFMKVVKSIENFWFTTVELPPRGRTEV